MERDNDLIKSPDIGEWIEQPEFFRSVLFDRRSEAEKTEILKSSNISEWIPQNR